MPENRSYYGIHYFQIWKSLLDALDNSQNIEDFSEYKHRDNLIDQVRKYIILSKYSRHC